MRRWFTGETGAEASGVIVKAIISIDFDFTMFIFFKGIVDVPTYRNIY